MMLRWCCGDVTASLLSGNFFAQLPRTYSGDISDPESLEHEQCSSTMVPFNQCRRVVIVAPQCCPKKVASSGVMLVSIQQENNASKLLKIKSPQIIRHCYNQQSVVAVVTLLSCCVYFCSRQRFPTFPRMPFDNRHKRTDQLIPLN